MNDRRSILHRGLSLPLALLLLGVLLFSTAHHHAEGGAKRPCHTCALAHAPAAEAPAIATIAPPAPRAAAHARAGHDTAREAFRLATASRGPPTA